MPKETQYARIRDRISEYFARTPDLIARMSTLNALIYHKVSFIFWVGFYIRNEEVLTAGPYQGPLACPVLVKPNGVCWHTILTGKTTIVPDVDKFPGHVACDPRSRSEIALPVRTPDGEIIAVLDIDSASPARFDDTDRDALEKLVEMLTDIR